MKKKAKKIKIPCVDTRILKELVREIAGKNVEEIVDILQNKKDVNEFKIADKMKMTINQVRNILYKLHTQNIVNFTRKKDKQKGWYIYYWTLDNSKALEKFVALKNQEITRLHHLLASRENKSFYSCPGGCVEFNEETALHHNFVCPECGQLLHLSPHNKTVDELKKKIEETKGQLSIAQSEVDKINVKLGIFHQKEEDKEKKDKKEKRAKLKKARKRQEARETRKSEKAKANRKIARKKAKAKKRRQERNKAKAKKPGKKARKKMKKPRKGGRARKRR